MVQLIAVSIAALIVVWGSTVDSTVSVQQVPSLDDIIGTDPDLTSLADAFLMAAFDDAENEPFLLCNTDGCNLTVFAPTNDAFAKFNDGDDFFTTLLSPPWTLHLRNLLAMHATVPNGTRVSAEWTDRQKFLMRNREVAIATRSSDASTISVSTKLTKTSNLTAVDVIASNGVLHKVNEILLPLFMGVDVFALGTFYRNEFQILSELLASVGLVGIRNEFTLLAPTDAAFLALGDDVLAELRKDSVKSRALLVNHVIFGVNPSGTLTDGLVLASLGGMNITFTVSDDVMSPDSIVRLPVREKDFEGLPPTYLKVNGVVNVLFSDLLAKNGLAHVVDRVIFDPTTLTTKASSPSSSAAPTTAPSLRNGPAPMGGATPSSPSKLRSIFDMPRMPPF